MSPYLICALVATSTLAAAVIACCCFQAVTAKARKGRRPLTLAESRPNSRRLSSIPLEDQAISGGSPYRHEPQRSLTDRRAQSNSQERPLPSVSNAAPSQHPTTESKLNSIQTIQARSAALKRDNKPAGRVEPGSSTQVKAPSEQGLQEHTETQPEHCQGTPPSADAVAGTPTASLPPTCKETESADAVCHDTDPPCEQQGIIEGADDIQTMGSPGRLEPVDGLPQSTETSQGVDWAHSDKARSGLPDTDLSDIDGGSLPTSTQKTLQKSRR